MRPRKCVPGGTLSNGSEEMSESTSDDYSGVYMCLLCTDIPGRGDIRLFPSQVTQQHGRLPDASVKVGLAPLTLVEHNGAK